MCVSLSSATLFFYGWSYPHQDLICRSILHAKNGIFPKFQFSTLISMMDDGRTVSFLSFHFAGQQNIAAAVDGQLLCKALGEDEIQIGLCPAATKPHQFDGDDCCTQLTKRLYTKHNSNLVKSCSCEETQNA